MPGVSNAWPRTTFAVLRPTPGSVTRSSSVAGTSPPKRFTSSDAAGADVLRLALVEPARLDELLKLLDVALGEVACGVEAGEERGRELVHAGVGALRREDDRDEQLQRAVVVQPLELGVERREPVVDRHDAVAGRGQLRCVGRSTDISMSRGPANDGGWALPRAVRLRAPARRICSASSGVINPLREQKVDVSWPPHPPEHRSADRCH